jgi:glucosylceramidase
MKNRTTKFFGLLLVVLLISCQTKENKSTTVIQWRLTTPDKSVLFASQAEMSFQSDSTTTTTLAVDTASRFQSVDGFGYTLTGGSAQLINALPDSTKDALLRELFTTEGNGIGISFLRISVGASDLDDHVFSYNDLPKGKTDAALKSFSIAEDQKNLIPVLKKILALNPTVKIMGSPWSAPAWMKTNGNPKGGSLKKEYYAAYAQYLAKYIQNLQNEGISLHSITIQNEPENPNNTPSMLMTASEQGDFIKNHLGPEFAKATIQTKIIIFDHNCDHPEYAFEILGDTAARKFVNGTAFHMYLGEISAMSQVHDTHPDKDVYFTEQWTSGDGEFGGDLKWHTYNLMIGAPRNWSKTVLEWNLAADPQFNPHTSDGGCDRCLGALTIGETVKRNVSYYIIAHASKMIRPNAVRIRSNMHDALPNVAFQNEDGSKVLLVLNNSNASQNFQIKFGNQFASTSLSAGAVATYMWQ